MAHLAACVVLSIKKEKSAKALTPLRTNIQRQESGILKIRSPCFFYFSELRSSPWEGGLRRAWPPFSWTAGRLGGALGYWALRYSLWESLGLRRASRNDVPRRQINAKQLSEGTPKKICLQRACISLLTAVCSRHHFYISAVTCITLLSGWEKKIQNINPAFYYRS